VKAWRTRSSICAATLCAAVLGACGSGDDEKGRPIPTSQVAALERELDAVKRRFEHAGGACGDIENRSRPDVQGILDQIPGDVDPEVRDALQRSFDRLFELSAAQCDEEKGEDTTPTETLEIPTTPTVPTETETTPTETEQLETEQDDGGGGNKKKQKKNRGGGQGQGAPGGNDGGALGPEGE
jgi:hypothetical protein